MLPPFPIHRHAGPDIRMHSPQPEHTLWLSDPLQPAAMAGHARWLEARSVGSRLQEVGLHIPLDITHTQP